MLRARHPFRSRGGKGVRGGPGIVWDMDPTVREREGGGACAEKNCSMRWVTDDVGAPPGKGSEQG